MENENITINKNTLVELLKAFIYVLKRGGYKVYNPAAGNIEVIENKAGSVAVVLDNFINDKLDLMENEEVKEFTQKLDETISKTFKEISNARDEINQQEEITKDAIINIQREIIYILTEPDLISDKTGGIEALIKDLHELY